MADHKCNHNQNLSDKLIAVLLRQSWLEILGDVGKAVRRLVQSGFSRGLYEVLDYEAMLELEDPEGTRATFKKREKVRYLRDNGIAYQDQAWGDGEILVDYRCTPGTPVDRYRSGYKTYILISRREVKNKGDVDEFNIEWSIRQGFLRSIGCGSLCLVRRNCTEQRHQRLGAIKQQPELVEHVATQDGLVPQLIADDVDAGQDQLTDFQIDHV